MKTILKIFGYIISALLMAAGLIAIVLYIMSVAVGNNPLSNLVDKVTDGDNAIITTMAPTDSDGDVLEDTQQNGTNSVSLATPTPTVAPTPAASVAPSPDASAEPSPDTTPEASPEVTPEATPEPTPAPTPTPEPQPAGTPVGSGTISSSTGKWIEIDAVWNAETIDADTAKVTVVVNLRSFRLNVGAKHNALEITVGKQSTSMDVKSLLIETTEEVTTELATYDFTVDAPIGKATLVPLKVNWHYGGTYSGAHLDIITAAGDITIDR